ncbi:DUF885 domain-containing protein [Longimicrobium terrae]|uniref:Uncharacterized protein (DUF885 family) n=1 Tax=Longimicrobium terrae TaxID=1639882 RepID=A0A841GV34_9BACT|nr:DUF885 domain-containing protein [Longimicrobium terrae]MBB4634759.1 uncharacterized protein (DUF885 family) [Longimicrobium terrae]MBB6069154.1 uncharacterized protein (DUF885 family) [Longimicrobium terrae]NNC32030.1 DUF885 domain-containing protein [Longimicrobium terrae]
MDRRSFVLQSAHAALFAGILPSLERLAAQAGPASPFTELRDRYFVRVLRYNPVTATYLGGDAYSPQLADINGKLRDYRPEALAAELAFYREAKAARDAIRPESLTPEERIDHAVLGAQLDFIIHQLQDLRYHERAVDTYVAEPFRGVDWQIQQMTDAGNGLLGTRDEWMRVLERLNAVPGYLQAAGANLRAGLASGNRPDWRMVQRDGIAGSRSNAEYFQDTLPELAEKALGDRPFAGEMTVQIRAGAGTAAKAYSDFADALQAMYPADDRQDRFAIGEREYEWRLRNNLRETRSAAELFAYGRAQTETYQNRIYEVAQQVARDANLPIRFGTRDEKNAGVRAVMEHLASDSPRNDDELLQWYVEAGRRAVQYGRDHQLFDVPADYRLDVYPTPPVLRSTIDAAYYPAPPFKTSGVGRFYLTPTGNDAAALRLNNRASVADTAIHEGFPGHDWHFKYLTQNAQSISNIRWLTPGAVEDSSAMWEDSMATEGWGLYAEELMAEAAPDRPYGFYTPGEYLYELQGQLMRAVRIVVDVGIHTGRMTFDEAVDYFTANFNFYPGACAAAESNADARAVCEGAQRAMYRYSKWPTQAITYNLGKNAILQLRDAYRQARGSAYSAKEFHERLMRMGTIPATYFRDYFLSQA